MRKRKIRRRWRRFEEYPLAVQWAVVMFGCLLLMINEVNF